MQTATFLVIIVGRPLAVLEIKSLTDLILVGEACRQQATVARGFPIAETFLQHHLEGIALLYILKKIDIPGKYPGKLHGQPLAFADFQHRFKKARFDRPPY